MFSEELRKRIIKEIEDQPKQLFPSINSICTEFSVLKLF